MPKGDYQRKLRRIDYSKKEIANQLHCAENTVDSRIKQLCKDYDLPDGYFKRDGYGGLNFFPPEYTPLLIELLKNNEYNPATPRKRKHDNVTAEDVVAYNRKMLDSLMGNTEIPIYLKEWMRDIPWYRTSQDIVELLNLLVLEMELFIHNLLDSQNTDVGQGLRMIVRNLDVVNYRMFQGNQMCRMAKEDNVRLKEMSEKGAYEELLEMNDNEREEVMAHCPPLRTIYNSYEGTAASTTWRWHLRFFRCSRVSQIWR